jgi:hypothetical protein
MSEGGQGHPAPVTCTATGVYVSCRILAGVATVAITSGLGLVSISV